MQITSFRRSVRPHGKRAFNSIIISLFIGLVAVSPCRVLSSYEPGHIFLEDSLHQARVEVYTREIPRYLYHWVRPEILAQLVEEGYAGGPYPRLGRSTGKFDQYFPQFRTDGSNPDRGALFTWTNPETITRGGLYEIYGEVLIRFEIDVDPSRVLFVTVGRMNDDYMGDGIDGDIPVEDFDLVYHASLMREWIILDRRIITGFTVCPEQLRPSLEQGIDLLKTASLAQFHERIHFDLLVEPAVPGDPLFCDFFSSRNYPLYRLQRYLEGGREIIPSEFVDGTSSNLNELRRRIHRFRVEEVELYVREKFDEYRTRGSYAHAHLIPMLGLRCARAFAEIDDPADPTWHRIRLDHWQFLFEEGLRDDLNPRIRELDADVVNRVATVLSDVDKPIGEVLAIFERKAAPLPDRLEEPEYDLGIPFDVDFRRLR